jgi:hypothetical protein
LLQTIDVATIYYHFWGGLLRPRFDDPEYHNDFAIWVAHELHDKMLAERLALIDPSTFVDLEELRTEVIEVIESRLDEIDYPLWSQQDRQFEFIRSQIVIFDTRRTVSDVASFANEMALLSVGSIFYHFIDARRRNADGIDDFRHYLKSFAPTYDNLAEAIGEIDPYYSGLTQLREDLAGLFAQYASKGVV